MSEQRVVHELEVGKEPRQLRSGQLAGLLPVLTSSFKIPKLD